MRAFYRGTATKDVLKVVTLTLGSSLVNSLAAMGFVNGTSFDESFTRIDCERQRCGLLVSNCYSVYPKSPEAETSRLYILGDDACLSKFSQAIAQFESLCSSDSRGAENMADECPLLVELSKASSLQELHIPCWMS